MAQSVDRVKAFVAAEALAAFRRVKLNATVGEVEYADQGDSNSFVGYTLAPAASGAQVAVALNGTHTTFKAVASEELAYGATLYAAADGKVADTSSGNSIGTALEAAVADGDVIEILGDLGDGSQPSTSTLANYSPTLGGIPFIVQTVLTSSGGSDETIMASWPRKAKIMDAWMIARDANAANVTLKNDGNAFTGAIAKGTADDTIISFATIIAEQDEITAGDPVIATISATGVLEVFLLCMPIA